MLTLLLAFNTHAYSPLPHTLTARAPRPTSTPLVSNTRSFLTSGHLLPLAWACLKYQMNIQYRSMFLYQLCLSPPRPTQHRQLLPPSQQKSHSGIGCALGLLMASPCLDNQGILGTSQSPPCGRQLPIQCSQGPSVQILIHNWILINSHLDSDSDSDSFRFSSRFMFRFRFSLALGLYSYSYSVSVSVWLQDHIHIHIQFHIQMHIQIYIQIQILILS